MFVGFVGGDGGRELGADVAESFVAWWHGHVEWFQCGRFDGMSGGVFAGHLQHLNRERQTITYNDNNNNKLYYSFIEFFFNSIIIWIFYNWN